MPQNPQFPQKRRFLIRPPKHAETEALTALNLRSKAFWGYDRAFMTACTKELRVTPRDLAEGMIVLAESENQIAGMAQLGRSGKGADLLKLFVDPPFMGCGAGRLLSYWCAGAARNFGATRLLIESDPQAQSFYERMGARCIGSVPSGSVPGRTLPHMEYQLC